MDANEAISDSDLLLSITNHSVYGWADGAVTQLEAEKLFARSKPPSVHLAQHLLHLLRHGWAMTSPSIKHKLHVHKRFSTANCMLVTFSSAKTYRPNVDHELMPRWDLNCAFATSFWCLQKLIRMIQRSKKYQQPGHAVAGSNVKPALPWKKY